MVNGRKIKMRTTFRVYLSELRENYLNGYNNRRLDELNDRFQNYEGIQKIETLLFVEYCADKFIEKHETPEEREKSKKVFKKNKELHVKIMRDRFGEFIPFFDSPLVEFRKEYLEKNKGVTKMSDLTPEYSNYSGVQEIEIEGFVKYCSDRFKELETPQEHIIIENRIKSDTEHDLNRLHRNLTLGRYNTQKDVADELRQIILKFI